MFAVAGRIRRRLRSTGGAPNSAQKIITPPIFSAEKATIRRKFQQGCRCAFSESGLQSLHQQKWAENCMEVAAYYA
jgi:hypothetical protein